MGNTVVEEDETFTVILQTSEAEVVTFRNEQAVVTIIETDGEKPILMFAM